MAVSGSDVLLGRELNNGRRFTVELRGTKLSDFLLICFFGAGTIYLTRSLGLLDQCRLDESLRDIMYMPAVITSYGPMIHNHLHALFPFSDTKCTVHLISQFQKSINSLGWRV